MNHTIRCYTLFDITSTGILNRSKPPENAEPDWLHKRNTQSNFDTVLQVISLRSQPEIVKYPEQTIVNLQEFEKFGFLLEDDEKIEIPVWVFEFDVQHPSVFNDGINDLGALYQDCTGVPMIRTNTAWEKLPAFLDSSVELRNIYFEIK